MTPSLLVILSIPRSGSTVLTAMLDRYEGVICLPESGFPQALEFAGEKILKDRRRAAALYQTCNFSGTVLDLAESEQCIRPDAQQTLIQLCLASAEKLGRPASSIRTVVWKSTRMISRRKLLIKAAARFVVLHRDLRNVFESQLRVVDFGKYNRNPARFAAFAASYEAIFRQYPPGTRFLSYARLDEEVKGLVEWLGLDGHLRESGPSSLESTSRFAYHTTILDKFQNRDAEKASRISPRQAAILRHSYEAFLKLGALWNAPRLMADRKVFRGCLQRATELISQTR